LIYVKTCTITSVSVGFQDNNGYLPEGTCRKGVSSKIENQHFSIGQFDEDRLHMEDSNVSFAVT